MKKKKGFSLVEVLLYMALLAVLGLSVSQVASGVISDSERREVRQTVRSNADFVMKYITEYILSSEAINSPTSGSAQTLSLNSQDNLLDPVVFGLSNGYITESKAGVSSVNITPDSIVVDNISFTSYAGTSGPGGIEVSFTLSYNGDRERVETNYTESFSTYVSIRR